MKKLIILSAILASYFSEAQIKAVTDDGKEVVLFENKTWKFVNESDEKTLETIDNNEIPFTKDKSSTFLFRSKRLNMGIYVDPKKWTKTDAFKSPFLEYAFLNNTNPNLYGIFTSENIEIASLKNLRDVLISSVQNRADYFKLKTSEYRTVNGLKVVYVNYMANTKGMDFEYMTYAFLENEGYCTISVYCSAKIFESSKQEMEKFLNGLVEAKKAEQSKVEVYQSPPPPMEMKKKN